MTSIQLSEYTSASVSAPLPTPEDLKLAGELAQDRRLIVGWNYDGTVSLTSSSWIGTVKFTSFVVEIHPKLAGGEISVLAMADYASGVSALSQVAAEHLAPVSGGHLLDLIGMLLVREAEAILRGGLHTDYRDASDGVRVLRGRLDIKRQIGRHFDRVDVLECDFQEHDTDNAENQLVLAALLVAGLRCQTNWLRAKARRLSAIFQEACTPLAVSPADYRRRIVYGRRNESYRQCHYLSYMLLEGLGVDDLYRHQQMRCFSFLIDMNTLFEAFVTRLITDALLFTSYAVQPQAKDRSVLWNQNTNRSYGAVIPDLLITHPGGIQLPGDVKYKRYDARRLDPSDIYQLFLYAYGLYRGSGLPSSFLLYPSDTDTAPTAPIHLDVRSPTGQAGAQVVAVGFDVQKALADVAAGRSPLGSPTEGLVNRLLCLL